MVYEPRCEEMDPVPRPEIALPLAFSSLFLRAALFKLHDLRDDEHRLRR